MNQPNVKSIAIYRRVSSEIDANEWIEWCKVNENVEKKKVAKNKNTKTMNWSYDVKVASNLRWLFIFHYDSLICKREHRTLSGTPRNTHMISLTILTEYQLQFTQNITMDIAKRDVIKYTRVLRKPAIFIVRVFFMTCLLFFFSSIDRKRMK